MAKKKQEEQRIDFRAEVGIHAKLKKLSEESGLSVNQLLNGIVHWGLDHAHVGRVTWNEDAGEYVEGENFPNCVWFGWKDEDSPFRYPVYALEFTARRAVLESGPWRKV